jgi:ribosome-associated protein
MEKIEFTVEGEYIHLIQLLKALSLVSTGGHAKMVVEDGLVKYNGEIDFRKRLKVRKGDVIEFENSIINVN